MQGFDHNYDEQNFLHNSIIKANNQNDDFINWLIKENPESEFHLLSRLDYDFQQQQARSQENEQRDGFESKNSFKYIWSNLNFTENLHESKQINTLDDKQWWNTKHRLENTDPIEEIKFKETEKDTDFNDKLMQLQNTLRLIKGVKLSKVDDGILSRTFTFGQKSVAEQLNIPYRKFKSILNKLGIKINAGRKINSPTFEHELIEWINQLSKCNKYPSKDLIKRKAQEIRRKMISYGNESMKKFKFSKGWLDKFLKRNGLI